MKENKPKPENADIVKLLLKALATKKELNEVLGTSLEILRENLNLDSCAVLLYNASFEKLNLEFQYGLTANFINKMIVNRIENIKVREFVLLPTDNKILVQNNLKLNNILRSADLERKFHFSFTIITLKSGGYVRGYLWLIKKEPYQFSKIEMELFKEISDLLAGVIEIAQEHNELHKTIEQLEKLINVQNSVLIDLDINNILKRSINQIINIFDPDFVQIIIEKENVFEVVGKDAKIVQIDQNTEIFYLHRNVINILKDKRDFLIFKDINNDRMKFPYGKLESINSCVILPIFIERNIEGFFLIGKNTPGYFLKEDIPLYTAFPFLISQALYIGKLHEERLSLQHQLFQANKMESIGILAGGISHDFNNALTGIIGAADLIELSIKGDSKLLKYIKSIQKSGQRMANWTKQLLAYARGGGYQLKNLDLNNEITRAFNIVQGSLSKKIVISFSLEPSLNLIEADSDSMEQVLTNIFLNAGESIADKGYIQIFTENIDTNSRILNEKRLKKDKEYVKVTISDSGSGIDKKIIERVFDPFFTTKFAGRGLGLSAAYGIIDNYSGKIYIESEINSGTIVEIFLPVVSKSIPQRKEERKTGSDLWRSTIMIVSSFDINQAVVYKKLATSGYRTIEIGELDEISGLIKKYDYLDIIFFDIKFSGLFIENTLSSIKKSKRDIKLLFAIEYDENDEVIKYFKDKTIDYIKKPFDAADLLSKINKIIENLK